MKKVIAWTGIIIIAIVWLIAIIFAFIDTPFGNNMFLVAMFCMVFIPIIMHFMIRLHERAKKRKEDMYKENGSEE